MTSTAHSGGRDAAYRTRSFLLCRQAGVLRTASSSTKNSKTKEEQGRNVKIKHMILWALNNPCFTQKGTEKKTKTQAVHAIHTSAAEDRRTERRYPVSYLHGPDNSNATRAWKLKCLMNRQSQSEASGRGVTWSTSGVSLGGTGRIKIMIQGWSVLYIPQIWSNHVKLGQPSA